MPTRWPKLFRQRRQRRIRVRGAGGNANPERADLSVGGLIELDGAANVGGWPDIGRRQRERIVPVRGQGDGVGRDLSAGRRREPSPEYSPACVETAFTAMPVAVPLVLSKANDVAVGVAALQRHHRFLVVVAEDHKAADVVRWLLSCAEPVRRFGAPLLTINSVAPAARVCVTDGAVVSAMLPCGNVKRQRAEEHPFDRRRN